MATHRPPHRCNNENTATSTKSNFSSSCSNWTVDYGGLIHNNDHHSNANNNTSDIKNWKRRLSNDQHRVFEYYYNDTSTPTATTIKGLCLPLLKRQLKPSKVIFTGIAAILVVLLSVARVTDYHRVLSSAVYVRRDTYNYVSNDQQVVWAGDSDNFHNETPSSPSSLMTKNATAAALLPSITTRIINNYDNTNNASAPIPVPANKNETKILHMIEAAPSIATANEVNSAEK